MCRRWRQAIDDSRAWLDVDTVRFDDNITLSSTLSDDCWWSIMCRRMRFKRFIQHWRFITRFITRLRYVVVANSAPKKKHRMSNSPFIKPCIVELLAVGHTRALYKQYSEIVVSRICKSTATSATPNVSRA